MSSGHTRPASRRQAELDDWLNRAAVEGVTDLASLRGTMRAPTNLLQQLAEAVLDSSVSILPDGGLPHLRQAWSEFEAQQGRSQPDPEQGMSIVADPLAACVAVILGLVSPGRHVAVIEPIPPQVIDAVRRVGAMARSVAMRPTEWEFVPAEFAHRVGSQTELIVVADPNPYSGQYLSDEARAAVIAAVQQFGCFVLLDQSARQSVVEEVDENAAAFVAALGANCLRVDVAPAAVLAGAASAAAIMGSPELVAPVRSAASTFGLAASTVAQSVLARRFADGVAIDDAATVQGLVSSGRALLLDGLDDVGVLGLGGPGGWYVPVRAQALYEGPDDVGEVLAARAGLGVLPLAPFYAEGSSDPYILMSYLRDSSLLEDALGRLERFYESEGTDAIPLALPAPEDWGDVDIDDDVDEEEEFGDAETFDEEARVEPAEDAQDYSAAAMPKPSEPEPEPEPEHIRDTATEPIDSRADVPEPERPRASPEPEPFDGLAEDDAKYRAAMAGTLDEGGIDETPDEHQDSGRRDPVILPFGRRRRERAQAREHEEPALHSREPEPRPETPDEPDLAEFQEERVPVFKLSVPDIASPDIPAPQAAEEEQDAGRGPDDEPDSGGEERPVEGIVNEPDDERARTRRDDRPFFSDDPLI